MIVQKEITTDQVYDIVNELIGAQDIDQIQTDIVDIKADV